MFTKKLFNVKMPPACEYCEHGRQTSDKKMVLCLKRGIVAPFYKCNKFIYAPTKRIPKKMPKLPTFSAEEFEL